MSKDQSQATASRWADLAPRILTAFFLVIVGGAAVWAGGGAFAIFVCVVCGLMVWELHVMLRAPDQAKGPVVSIMVSLMAVATVTSAAVPGFMFLSMAGVLVVGFLTINGRGRIWFCLYALAILLTGAVLIGLRDGSLMFAMWMIGVVVASDIAGYFAGRMIGGRKFWPRVSPKKTWSGTIAGWALAALVGLGYGLVAGLPIGALVGIAAFSAVTAFGAQMGDIAESAIKRFASVKDSSNLLPGHGGVMDRFDAMIGAALVVLVLTMGAGGYVPVLGVSASVSQLVGGLHGLDTTEAPTQ